MANSMGVEEKPVPVGSSPMHRRVLLYLVCLAVFLMALLWVGHVLIKRAGFDNLGSLLRGERYDRALPPVTVVDLKAVLDKDMAGALKSGELSPSTGAGVSIAVVEHGITRVFSYGAARTDSIYEIGSISKTFTGLILAQMVEQGEVHLDDPVREWLPPGVVSKPAGDEITLLSLATQHSGLPRVPETLSPDSTNPYANYRAADLYAYLTRHGVARKAQAGFLYSNLGFGLLGQALSNRAGMSYEALLEQEVTGPLGLNDTVVSLSSEQRARFLPGHDSKHHPAHAWEFDALAGCGAIRSTAPDMLAYLQANLHPDGLKAPTGSPAATTLSSALLQSHQLRADAMPGTRIALAWFFDPATGNYWHAGATGGYSSFAFFHPKEDFAAIVLSNTADGFTERLGRHIEQRLAGEPAISLAN